MPKTNPQATAKPPNVPGLPFLTVGSPTRARTGRAKIGQEHLQKLLDWFQQAQPTLKQLSASDVGIPAFKLAEELGLQPPQTGNRCRANLQRHFDELSIGARLSF